MSCSDYYEKCYTIINARANLKKPVEPSFVASAMLNKFNTMNLYVYSESENECSNQDDEGWSKSEHSGSDISCANEGKQKKKKLKKHREKSTSSNLQSDGEKRSKSPDSGNVSGDDVHSKLTSPLPPEPKAEKPPKPLKPANLQMRPQPSSPIKVNNVEPVSSKVQESSTPSVKDRVAQFGGGALKSPKGKCCTRITGLMKWSREAPHTSLLFQNKFTYMFDCIKIT